MLHYDGTSHKKASGSWKTTDDNASTLGISKPELFQVWIFEECSRIKTSGKGQIHVLIYGLCSFDISVEERQFLRYSERK